MFKIGEFSKLCKTTIKTLRYYDEIGIFKPSYVENNGYRYYTVDDLEKIALIRQLRALGVSVDEIRNVLDGKDLEAVLSQRSMDIQMEIAKKKDDLLQIDYIVNKLKKGDIMQKYQAIQKEIPSFNVYYRHGIIASMADMFDFASQTSAEAKQNNPALKHKNYCFVTYEAPEYQENDVELEYVEAVESLGKDTQNVKFKTVPAITAVCVQHKGAYSSLADAYAYALAVVKEHGYSISDKIREVYIHGRWDRGKDESLYLTEIQIPIENRAK